MTTKNHKLMKNKLALMQMFAAMALMGPVIPQREQRERKNIQSKAHAKIEQNKSKGLKQYFYGKNSVWALNQKNADRKAYKNNWI